MTSLILDPFVDGAMPPARLASLKAKGIDMTDLELASSSTAIGSNETDSVDNVSSASPVEGVNET